MTSHSDDATAQQVAEEIASLPSLTDEGVSRSFRIVAPSGDAAYTAYRLNLTDDAARDIAGIAEDTRARLTDSNLIAYGPAVLIPPSHAMYVEENLAALLADVERLLGSSDVEVYSGPTTASKQAKIFAARFGVGNSSVTFYRLAEPLLEFKKSRLVGLLLSGGQYKTVEPVDLLLMKPAFDVIVYKQKAFFWGKSAFERSFGFTEQLKEASSETFDTVAAPLAIRGMNEFRDACTSQPQMMAKMASIKRSMEDPDYVAAMTMAKLLAYVDEHPEFGIELEGEGADRSFVFDPADLAKRFQILKLLDDDFLHSVLTSRDYEAGSKVRTTG